MDFTKFKAAANAYTATAAFVSSNKDTVQKFVSAEVECLNYVKTHKPEAVASIRKWSGTDDQALAEYAYDFFQPLWRSDPTVDPTLIANAVREAAKKADKPAPSDLSTFVDNSFVDQATKG